MIVAGVVIDAWKLEIFERVLGEAEFAYTQHSGITPDTILLSVKCESAQQLQPYVVKAQRECKKIKGESRDRKTKNLLN